MTTPIVICGNDATLLRIRRMLLEHAGFCVETVLGHAGLALATARQVLLCYSLTESEQVEAIALVRSRCPGASILAMGADVRERVSQACETMSAFEPPAALIERARRLSSPQLPPQRI